MIKVVDKRKKNNIVKWCDITLNVYAKKKLNKNSMAFSYHEKFTQNWYFMSFSSRKKWNQQNRLKSNFNNFLKFLLIINY